MTTPTTTMTTPTDFRALCAELADALHGHTSLYEGHECELVTRARTTLAQPEPEGVTDAASRVAHYLEQRRLIRGLDPEEIHALHAGTDEPRQVTLTASDLEALTHFARPTIEPVPVYERWLQAVHEDAASRVAHYLEQRRLIRGLDPEEIHALHAGTDEPRQVTLTASDLEALTHFARPTIEPVPVYERWLQAVAEELAKAQAKHPEWPTDPLHAIAIIGEEFGELTQAVLQVTYEPGKSLITDVQREAVQTAAMALRFLQSMDAYVYADDTNTHRQDNALPVPGAEVG